jgi:hypothetical protein
MTRIYITLVGSALCWCLAEQRYGFDVRDPFAVMLRSRPGCGWIVPTLWATDHLLWLGLSWVVAWTLSGIVVGRRLKRIARLEEDKASGLSVTIGRCAGRWISVPAGGLYCGVAYMGATGSGKTAHGLRPALRDLFNAWKDDRSMKIGGLVLGVKANLWTQVKEEMALAGRVQDCHEISATSAWSYNPLASDLDAEEKAFVIADILEQIDGKSKEPFWRAASEDVIKIVIKLHEMVDGWVTLRDVYRAMTSEALLLGLMSRAEERVLGHRVFLFTRETYGPDGEKGSRAKTLKRHGAEWVDDIKMYAAPWSQELEYYCRGTDDRPPCPHEDRRVGGTGTADEVERLESVRFWLVEKWSKVSTELKASIAATANNRLSMFDDPVNRRMFCPEKDAGNLLPRMSELIERGQLVGVDFPATTNEAMSRIVGVMAKRDFQRAVLGRNLDEIKRPVAFVCDEYQVFCTMADARFFGQSRESKCVSIVAFQSVASLEATVGNLWESVVEHFRTKLFLGLTDPKTAELAEKLCGKSWVWRQSYQVGESGQKAKVIGDRVDKKQSGVSGGVTRSEHLESRYTLSDFAELPIGTCIGLVFDGQRPWKPLLIEMQRYDQREAA